MSALIRRLSFHLLMPFRSLCLVAFILLLAGAMFFPLPHDWSVGWRGELLNRLHTPLFAVAAMLLLRGRQWKTFLVAAVVAALVEIIQPAFGRSSSMEDFIWGLIGISGAIAWQARLIFLRALALILAIAPPGMLAGRVIAAKMTAAGQFPVLFAATDQPDTILWQVSRLAKETPEGFMLGRGSSVRLEVTKQDWSEWEALVLTGTVNDGPALELGIRLDLQPPQQGRVHLRTTFQPGRNRLHVPWPKKSPLPPVKQIVFFVSAGKSAASLTLNDIRLVADSKK